ncbi:MAG: aminomethyl-transferring glycine dehydrogenase subunit GcvPA [Actinomycetota bacterium]
MPYGPHTDADRERMLATIGVATVDELFADIPVAVREGGLALGPGEPEQLLMPALERLSARNDVGRVSFLGAGAYRHHIPAAVDEIIRRGEFMTAYTPYQPEVSQGTLQTIYEYQSLIAELTTMDVVSASHYDGASAAAEAALMMLRATRRERILVSEGVHPNVREVIATYFADRFALETVAVGEDGATDLTALQRALTDGDPVAGVMLANPNFFGILEPMADAASRAHEAGALFTAVVEPTSLMLLAPPGEVGADIATAEGQPLGMPLQFGGPYLGILAATQTLARQIPGRLVGSARDAEGRPCYVMTMRAREQDIRREKAASNICTNQALCALAATVYVSTVGPEGLRNVAAQGAERARELEAALATTGVLRTHTGPYLNEFAVDVPDAARVHADLLRRGFVAGLQLGPAIDDERFRDSLLLCTTEMTTSDDVTTFAAAVAATLAEVAA